MFQDKLHGEADTILYGRASEFPILRQDQLGFHSQYQNSSLSSNWKRWAEDLSEHGRDERGQSSDIAQ